MDLKRTLRKRQKLHQHVIDTLAHLPRETAMSMILDWFGTESLERDVVPTLAPGWVPED